MKRLILPLVTCVLVGLVVVDRMSRMESTTLSAAPPSDSVADLGGQAAARPLRPVPPRPAPAAPGAEASRTPTLDRLARLAIRQQLAQLKIITVSEIHRRLRPDHQTREFHHQTREFRVLIGIC